MKNYTQIEGWFNYKETFDLLLQNVPKNGIFVECGAWLGQSSSYLADRISAGRPDITLYVVDSWKGSRAELTSSHILATKKDIYKIFLQNMGNRKYIPIERLSVEASSLFDEESLDVVFIDMSHEYEDVKQDLDVWLPKIKTNGYLAGHDRSWDGVNRAITEKFGEKIQKSDGDCWIFHKTN